MTKVINLTPESFVDLFILCLSWQWKPVSLVYTWSTVDKVVKILLSLGVITEPQVAMIRSVRTGSEHQRFLRRSIDVLYGTWSTESVDGGLTEKAQVVLSQAKRLCITINDPNRTLNLSRLVRDQCIHLTYAGATYAEGLAERFAPWVTHETFKAEEARREALFQSEAAHATAINAYRREVSGENNPRTGRRKSGPTLHLTKLW